MLSIANVENRFCDLASCLPAPRLVNIPNLSLSSSLFLLVFALAISIKYADRVYALCKWRSMRFDYTYPAVACPRERKKIKREREKQVAFSLRYTRPTIPRAVVVFYGSNGRPLQLRRVKVMFLIITERAFTMLRGYLRLDGLPRTIVRECRPLPFYLYALSTALFFSRKCATVINSRLLIDLPPRIFCIKANPRAFIVQLFVINSRD